MATTRTPPSRRVKRTLPKCPPPEETPTRDSALQFTATEDEEEGEEMAGRGSDFNGELVSGDQEIVSTLLKNSENCRRFSSRVRRKTDFFNSAEKEEDEDEPMRGRERSRKAPLAVRKLSFEPRQSPLVAPPPGTLCSTGAVDHQTNNGLDKNVSNPASPHEHFKSYTPPPHALPQSGAVGSATQDGDLSVERPPVGSMVWGKLPGYDWWPGLVISYSQDKSEGEPQSTGETERGGGLQVWIKWYGENNLSQILTEKVALFSNFSEYFSASSLKGVYKRGIFMAIKEAAKRCRFNFESRAEDKTLRWEISESSPKPKLITGRDEGAVGGEGVVAEATDKKNTAGEKGVVAEQQPKPVGSRRRKRQVGGGRGDKGRVLLNSLENEMLQWALHGFQPAGPAGLEPTAEHNVEVQVLPVGKRSEEGSRTGEEDEPPKKKARVMLLQVKKKAHFDSLSEGKIKIDELCLSCGTTDVIAEHPFFEGGLCKECKDSFLECTYLFDEDGTQMYCCICMEGEEVFMCDVENCAKVYCGPCIEKLCGASELQQVKEAEKWLCYMCSPERESVGLLTRRQDWDRKLQELFKSDHEEYYSPPTYPPIPPENRKPIRVLGLFDGIGTGLVVLKELGIELDTYVASEVDEDAIKVSRVWHHEIFHVGDISKITEKEIQALGPFDLVIGGSPCNDLSIVNPARKGIYEGTGRLFFEFFRILSYVRLCRNCDQPLFWLYENVVSMRANDKQTISRFLQCNPVVVDAKDISATHRARYFWGNIPGMNSPLLSAAGILHCRAITPLPGDRLTLQDCLEPNCSRFAQFQKLRTITTKMNSIKQTKAAIYPIRMGPLVSGAEQPNVPKEQMQGDVLWCTEMERLFGLPDHYTDVANLGRSGRQRLLGKAWSVPVLRHILSPLKDYFTSNTTLTRKSSTSKSTAVQQSP